MKQLMLLGFMLVILSGQASAGSFSWGPGSNAAQGTLRVMAQSAVPQPIYSISGWTASPLAEFVLATIPVPGTTMSPTSALRLNIHLQYTNSSNNKNIKVKVGAVTAESYTRTTTANQISTIIAKNRNSLSSQIWTTGDGIGTAPAAPTTIDFSADQNITITGQTSLESGGTATAITGAAGTCTATLTAHGLATGEYVQMAGGATCSTSGNPNADPVQITVTNANTFTYACSCLGTEASTMPTEKRYSVLQLESYTLELLPGVN